jgi:Domain of unknown function (DUF4389)
VNVSEHPVRLRLSDDLERDRLTVFFRLILAIPHFIWLALWGIAAFLGAIANWLATLALGRSPDALHGFLAAYVKYATQFYAYFHLAANPYPSFTGRDGYPVDLTIAAPAAQNRLTVALRGLLFLPSLLLCAALAGAPSYSSRFSKGNGNFATGFGLLHSFSLLGWFAIMARGRMPRGLRDGAAYALSYGAQFWAYAFLLTDRYPDSDPLAAVPDLPVRADPVHLELDDDLRRSRLTVFFRLLLALPHLIWLTLWGVLVYVCAVLNWFATLFAGRSPAWLHRFLAAYLRYAYHVYAFLFLVANPFPGFVGKPGSYPFEVSIAPRERQNRWKTGFRIVLVLPAILLTGAYNALAYVVAVLGWFSSLARGRIPRGLRNAGALALRYQAQTHGYLLLLTDAYPYSGPLRGDGAPGERDAPTGQLSPSGEPASPAPTTTPPASEPPDGPQTRPDVGLS